MAHNGTYYLGNEFFVYTSDSSTGSATPFAYSTECTLSISADQISTANKQSGAWASALPGQLSWSISTSALYTNQNNYSTIFGYYASRTPLYVTFGQITSLGDASNPINTALDSSAAHWTGKAYITNLELNAGNNEVASFSVTFTGEGQLTQAGS